MKAIRVHQFGGPEVLKLESIADPKPGPGEILVQVKAAGVNPVDTYIRSGLYGNRNFPYTPGMDGAGTVAAVGSGVQAFKPGDRVYIAGSSTGTYAELSISKEFQIHPLASHLSFDQGAAVGVPYGTAYYGLFDRGRAVAGETVLIHGASGGVGTAAVQIAKAHGLVVIGTAGTPKGQELVRQEGAKHVLDHTQPDYLDKLMSLTQGRGVDVILEMLANVNLGKDLKVLAPHGRVVVIGSRGKVEIDPREMFVKHTDIRGMSLISTTEEELRRVHEALVAGFEKKTLKPVVGLQIPLAEAGRAHEEVMKPGSYGKIVLHP